MHESKKNRKPNFKIFGTARKNSERVYWKTGKDITGMGHTDFVRQEFWHLGREIFRLQEVKGRRGTINSFFSPPQSEKQSYDPP